MSFESRLKEFQDRTGVELSEKEQQTAECFYNLGYGEGYSDGVERFAKKVEGAMGYATREEDPKDVAQKELDDEIKDSIGFNRY